MHTKDFISFPVRHQPDNTTGMATDNRAQHEGYRELSDLIRNFAVSACTGVIPTVATSGAVKVTRGSAV